MNTFTGSGVALITPFNADKSIDFIGLKKLVNHCIDGGINYLVVMGTTAENPTLNKAEKADVLAAVLEYASGRIPVVYGIGGNNTMALVEEMKETSLAGVSAILSASPYYNKPTQEGIYQHYKTLAENSPLPIILYNVPGRTSSNMSAQTTLRLAKDFKNIIGIKEASGNLEQVMAIIDQRPQDFLVISGDDNLTLPMIACGGEGVISVSGQAFPKVFTQMVNSALEGDFATSRKAHYRLFEVTKMLFEEGNPGGVKAALAHMGICGKDMRQPLWPISNDLDARIGAEIKAQELG
jgi:4-hydroxy-tetrahydrodipicolinate synthase